MPDWIDSAAAVERLGVKPATLYAYVSRGVLRRRYDPRTRRSLFDPAEIEQLARRGKPRRKPAPTEIAVESRVTTLGSDRPYYRSRDALELAARHRFEDVAEWLWGNDLRDAEPWRADAAAVAVARRIQRGLPADLLPLDRLQLVVTALAAVDPRRGDRDALAVAPALLAGMVTALPERSEPVDATLAALLWSRLAPAPPPGAPELKCLDTAMILLADHELAASTFAARVAASVRADPYAVVSTGLGVVGGPMHGGASLGVERLLAEIDRPADVSRAIGDRLRRGERIPGAGHAVYRHGDGRGTRLFDRLREIAPAHPKLVVAEAILRELRTRRLPEANIDFPLGLLTTMFGMPPGSGQTIFAVARTAGWLAHAAEEYASRTPFRPRALGPRRI
ncbi:citrate/2-methylcitrate synthase [Nocardia sp. NPDC004068]|uniref:citrate/2-methylcitrate synthase n=1 Tax=Nocardia sp. NPDC004068 TaxID=3364303 RepID=UPI0036B6F3C6